MNDPIYYHCPNGVSGQERNEFRKRARDVLANMPKYSAPEHTVFATYNNTDKPMLVERCYERAEIEAVTVAKQYRPWNWMGKIVPLRDFLQAADSCIHYVVATDANDVLLVEDPGCVIERFKEYECDMLFCNTMANWPRHRGYAEFEKTTYSESMYHCHLSAGGYVGRAPVVLHCLNRIITAWKERERWARYRRRFDDQHAWRYLHYTMYPRIQVDYRKRVFCRFDLRRHED